MDALLASAGGGGLLDDLGINLKVLGTQVVIFVTTFLVLSRILFGRVLQGMQAREEETRKSHEAIERDRAEVARLARDYEAQIAKVDRENYDQTQALLKEALAAAASTVAQAQAQAREQVDKAHAEILREKREALVKVREDVTRLTLQVVEKVLETPLDAATHGAVVRKFVSERS